MTDVNTLIATATANGWTDDSRYTRPSIRRQMSRLADGLMQAVTERLDGTVTWTVQRWDSTAVPTLACRGTAPTVGAALTAASTAADGIRATLF